jgi:hypothetical protein
MSKFSFALSSHWFLGRFAAKVMFFFEKKNQKTLGPAGAGPIHARARRTKSFFAARRPGSFFSKKEDSYLLS